MKITTDWKVNLKGREVTEAVERASQLGMRDTVADIWNAAIENSPKRTGHNMRSIAAEVSGMGTVLEGADAEPGRVVDDNKIQGAVYSTSGYGGYLEVGTHNDDGSWRMPPRPYFYPALVKNMPKLPKNIKTHLA